MWVRGCHVIEEEPIFLFVPHLLMGIFFFFEHFNLFPCWIHFSRSAFLNTVPPCSVLCHCLLWRSESYMQAACLSWTDQSVCSKLHSTAALAYLTLKQSLCLLPKQKAAKSPSVFFQCCKGIPMHVSNFCLEYIFPPLSCCCKSLVCFGMCHFLFFLRGQRCWVREGQLTQLWDFISGKFQDRSPASSVRVHLSSRRQPLLLQLSGNTQSSFIFPPLALPVRATQQPRCFSYCYSTEGFFYPLDLSQRLWRYRDVEYIPRRSDDSKTQDGNTGCKPWEDSCLFPSAHSLSLGGQLHAE